MIQARRVKYSGTNACDWIKEKSIATSARFANPRRIVRDPADHRKLGVSRDAPVFRLAVEITLSLLRRSITARC